VKKTGVHNVVIGGAPARVLAYPGDLLVEVVFNHNVCDGVGLLFFWPTAGFYSVDLATLPSNLEVALISSDGTLLEVHDPAEEPVHPRYPYASAVIMPRGWFDKHCTSVHCRLNLD